MRRTFIVKIEILLFRVIYANPSTRLVIIRCRHGPHNFVASALPFVTKVSWRSDMKDSHL